MLLSSIITVLLVMVVAFGIASIQDIRNEDKKQARKDRDNSQGDDQ